MWTSGDAVPPKLRTEDSAGLLVQYSLFPDSQTHTLSAISARSATSAGSSDLDLRSQKLVAEGSKKVKFEPHSVAAFSKRVTDPRLDTVRAEKALARSLSKPPNKVYPVKWTYDKHSVGEKPTGDIVVWNLPSAVTVALLRNNFAIYGHVTDVQIVEDPQTAVPMGMALVCFGGDPVEAHASAVQATVEANRKLPILGRVIRCGVNTANKVFEDVHRKTMEARAQRLLRQQESIREKDRQETMAKRKLEALDYKGPNGSVHPAQIIPDNMNMTAHERHILPYSLCVLPPGFERDAGVAPFIFISSKFVPTNKVSAHNIQKWLWGSRGRVLTYELGFFVVFESLSEAEHVFDEFDGRKVYANKMDFKLYMTLYVPDKAMGQCRIGNKLGILFPSLFPMTDPSNRPIGAPGAAPAPFTRVQVPTNGTVKPKQSNPKIPLTIEDSALAIRKELGQYLTKDIYDNNVNMLIHKVLQSEEFQKKRQEWEDLKKRESETRKADAEKAKLNGVAGPAGAPVAKSLDVSMLIGMKKPGIVKRKKAPAIKDMLAVNDRKRKAIIEDDEEDTDNETQQPEKESTSSESETPTTTAEPEVKTETSRPESLVCENNIYEPTVGEPKPVFDDVELHSFKPTLAWLKSCVKSEEDMEILKGLCETEPQSKIPNMEYWMWKHNDAHNTYRAMMDAVHVEEEDGEKYDFAREVRMVPALQNSTGSFRTEPYHKIPDADKFHYLIHRRRLTQLNPISEDVDEENTNLTSHAAVQSSRVNRANDRRFAADISSIAGGNLELNKLSKRKKPVQFARSAIHNWGLYALENISAGEMIIEYVGERIRQQVAELREKKYLRSGIGSSYLFRVDENTVIDASKKGGIARFINHCCEPSCTAKIIKVDGSKRIVIYALRDVKRNEELTYDYKFERETNDSERIRCLCGAPGCKGFLN